eukprot:2700969-Prymnesium_polylepis.1
MRLELRRVVRLYGHGEPRQLVHLLRRSKPARGRSQRRLRLHQSSGRRTVGLVALGESNKGCERQRDASQVEDDSELPIVS